MAAKNGELFNKDLNRIPPNILTLGSTATIADSSPSLLVRIEFPGAITQEALDLLVQKVRTIDPFVSDVTDEEIRNALMDQINKSSYFALRLFRNFLRYGNFPKDTIALSPVVLEPGTDGDLISVRREGDSVPAVLTIRMTVGRSPGSEVTSPRPRPGSPYGIRVIANTFADYVDNRISIVAEPAAWPGSGGVIASYGTQGAGVAARSCDPNDCLAIGLDVGQLQIGNAALLTGAVPFAKINSKLPYPWPATSQIGGVTTCVEPSDGPGDICLHERVALALVKQALSQVDPYLATRYQWQRYIARLDPELARLWPGNAWDAPQRERLRFVKALMSAERGYLAATSAKAAELSMMGALGAKLREQRLSERQYAVAIAEASKQKMSFAAILGAALSVMNYASAFQSKNFVGQMGAFNEVQKAAGANAAIRDQSLGQLRSAFFSETARSYADLFGEQYRVTVLGQQITASDISSLRVQFHDLYKRLSLPTLAPLDPICVAEQKMRDEPGWEDRFIVGNGPCTPTRPFYFDPGGALVHQKNPRSFHYSQETLGKFTIYNYASVAIGKQLRSSSVEQAHRLVGPTFGTLFTNCYELGDISRCEGNPQQHAKYKANGESRPAAAAEEADLEKARVAWIGKVNSLIAHE